MYLPFPKLGPNARSFSTCSLTAASRTCVASEQAFCASENAFARDYALESGWSWCLDYSLSVLLCAVVWSNSLGASEHFVCCVVPETMQCASCGLAGVTH